MIGRNLDTPQDVAEHPQAPWQGSVVAELAEVLHNREINNEYRHMLVRCGAVPASARPGQFFQLLCPRLADDQPFLRRPMSVYGADPEASTVEFLYKISGAGTRGLAQLRPGDTLDIMGPLGRGFTLERHWSSIVAVGRGAGLATLAPLARMAAEHRIKVTALLSARRPDLLVSVDVFARYGASVISVTDSEANSDASSVEHLLRGLIDAGACDAFFTCGSSRLARVQQRLAGEFDLSGQIAMEQQMACGLGFCHCCVRDFSVGGEIVNRRVCWEGPVFDLLEAL